MGAETPTVLVRPRGWHLEERHLVLTSAGTRGAFVDFGLYFFHNAQTLIASGAGPYFYLPKMESHREARLWNEVFSFAQERLAIPYGTIRATCLIETTPAAFEMTEILYELRDHSSGLNAGRWDYIFSMIKNFADSADHLLPDRSAVTMTSPFMAAYADLLVKTCHARGAHAIGGMAAFVPSKANPEATAAALEKTTADKAREAAAGFDGSWVAHPALVPDLHRGLRRGAGGPAAPAGPAAGGRVGDAGGADRCGRRRGRDHPGRGPYQRRGQPGVPTAWIGGAGAVAIHNLMEDAATVEISRMQVWQWVHHRATTADGTPVTAELVRELVAEEAERLTQGADEELRTRVVAARDGVRDGGAGRATGRSSSPATPTTPIWWKRPNAFAGIGPVLRRLSRVPAPDRGWSGRGSCICRRPDRARPHRPRGGDFRLR